MHESLVLAPHRFQFTYPADAKTYGNPADPEGWWLYDETAITALSFDSLIEIEGELYPLTLFGAMQGFRDQTILGIHAVTWLTIHLSNPDIAGPYKGFTPRDVLVHVEVAPNPEATPDADPLDSTTSGSSSPEESPTPSKATKRRSPTKRTSRPMR